MPNNERERLVEELSSIKQCSDPCKYPICYGCLADFIIADRKRVVDPLIKFKKDMGDDPYDWRFRRLVPTEYIDQTLSNAGIE